MAKRTDERQDAALKKLARTAAGRFLKQQNVTAVGIARKVKGNKQTNDLCLQVCVGKKYALEQLEAMATPPIPEKFSANGLTLPTDVVERSYEPANRRASKKRALTQSAPSRKTVVDPVIPGVSIGHPTITAGTAGCVVYDIRTGTPLILSNWHVLHGEDGNIGDHIVQPGAHDDNRTSRNVAGTLYRSHLGPAGDCAVATISNRKLEAGVHSLNVVPTTIADPKLGDTVVKSGRTTDVTFGRVNAVYKTAKIDYGSAGVVWVEGFEITPDPARPAENGEISMGGDSGSGWLLAPSGKPSTTLVGLHFAGEAGDQPEHALACRATAVFKKLEITLTPVVAAEVVGEGYAPRFLGRQVGLPTANTATTRKDVLDVDGEDIFHYVHFSLAMSRRRRMAQWVAWNIDGAHIRKISRSGLKFVIDPRLPAEAQIGDELYAKNPLDRGHIARRADLCWGTKAEAQRANKDSFYFTNITPQHAAFNQSSAGGIWGQLENALFEEVNLLEQRLSVMAGPIFKDSDPEYRGEKIPQDFWKVFYYVDAETETLHGKAYVLTQADLVSGLEAFELQEFSVYEVPLSDIERMSGLKLPSAGAGQLETIGVRRVGSVREIVQ